MRLPSVSVVMPSYNRAELIGESIENMLRQTLPPHEVIVVDDGSTDWTVDVIRGFGDQVRLIQQVNAGPGAARNTGLAAATGEFVQFCDSDDLATPNKLECQVGALRRARGDLAYGPWIPAWLADAEARYDGIVRQQRPIASGGLPAGLRGWMTLMQCCLVRRDLMLRVGGYPMARRTGEDVELLFRLILAGAKLIHTPDVLVLYRQHPSGISMDAGNKAMVIEDRVHMTRTVRELVLQSDLPVRTIDRLFWEAEIWDAERQMRRLTERRDVPMDFFFSALVRARQIRAGLRMRMTGSRYPNSFGTGPMTDLQRELVHGIGYRPVTF